MAKSEVLGRSLMESENAPAPAGVTTLYSLAAAMPADGMTLYREQLESGAPKNLGQVAARKNLNETAFFYPQLTSDTNGVVRMTFTIGTITLTLDKQ